jgi:hypothetical protein
MDDSAILFSPSAERLATTNAWAFLHWLRTTQGVELADWQALLEWANEQPGAARRAIRGFAGKAELADSAVPHLAELLLFLDVRPDDVLLVADAQDAPWGALEHTGATMTRYDGAPAAVLEAAADSGATILAVPAPAPAAAGFAQPAHGADAGGAAFRGGGRADLCLGEAERDAAGPRRGPGVG